MAEWRSCDHCGKVLPRDATESGAKGWGLVDFSVRQYHPGGQMMPARSPDALTLCPACLTALRQYIQDFRVQGHPWVGLVFEDRDAKEADHA